LTSDYRPWEHMKKHFAEIVFRTYHFDSMFLATGRKR
jgi:hypothetical protein